jgi:GTPase involved in cell partitioning and DNA repair
MSKQPPKQSITGNNNTQVAGNNNTQVTGDNSKIGVGQITGSHVAIHSDEGKNRVIDKVIEEQDRHVARTYEMLCAEMEKFHSKLERKDEYIMKIVQTTIDQSIEHARQNSEHIRLNNENMKRMDETMRRIGEGMTQIQVLIRIIDQQNQKIQERADKLLDMLKAN